MQDCDYMVRPARSLQVYLLEDSTLYICLGCYHSPMYICLMLLLFYAMETRLVYHKIRVINARFAYLTRCHFFA
jgi:hypothetical protein